MLNKPHLKTCVLCVALASVPLLAQAAGLGRLNVLSALGQPFRGEIELMAVQPGEMETLAVRLASVENYAAAQLSYPDPSLGLRLALDKRTNGAPVIRVTSSAAVDEPVFNLLVDLSWVGGKIQREYTALLDPAGYRAPSVGQLSAAPVIGSSSSVLPGRLGPSAAPLPKPVVAGASAAARANAETYSVKAGDTLSSIARAVQPEGVSLEQVIVGLYQANPDAFSGNMNRLKRGKILHVPQPERLAGVSKAEAIKEIRAQSTDWQRYRRQLSTAAARMPAAEVDAAAAGGKITARVEERNVAPADKERDVLKLSKGDGKSDAQAGKIQALEEEVAARKKALDEANQRVTELQKNIEQMESLAAVQSQAGAALQQKAEQAASAPVSAEASAVPASPVVAQQSKPKRVAPPPPPPEPSMMDVLMENILPIGGGLAAVTLGVAGILWSRKRRRPEVFENSLITSGDLKPNTVLGKTGGGVISTQAENSFLTDFSRQGLGTIDTDEVDPIAEADVYMAYGRDMQAEEILKDALVKDPQRQEIRMKLLDIYAARKDRIAFEEVAADLFAATAGLGPLWEQAAYQGRNLDPDNALYAQSKAVGATLATGAAVAGVAVAADVLAPVESEQSEEALPDVATASESASTVLDFEFDIPEVASGLESQGDVPPIPMVETEPAAFVAEEVSESVGIDWVGNDVEPEPEPVSVADDLVLDFAPEMAASPPEAGMAAEEEDELLALDLPIDFAAPAQADDLAEESSLLPAGADALVPDMAMPDFELPDLDLNLDLGESQPADAAIDMDAISADMAAEAEAIPASIEPSVEELPAVEEIDLDFDFNLGNEIEIAVPEKKLEESAGMPLDLELDAAASSLGDLDFSSDDPVQTKIDLARAYIDMGDVEGAREILQEAVQEGSLVQQELAKSLLENL